MVNLENKKYETPQMPDQENLVSFSDQAMLKHRKNLKELSRLFNEYSEKFDNENIYKIEETFVSIEEEIQELIKKLGTQKESKEIETTLNEIDVKKNQIALLKAMLIYAIESGESVNLETIKNLKLESKASLTISEIEAIIQMAEKNWAQIPAMQKTVTEGIKKDLGDREKEQEFIVLRYKGQVIGFLRFEKIDEDTVYTGSLNIFKELRGLKIAEQSLLEIIREKGKEKNVRATVSPRIQAGTCYIEKIGFVGTGYELDYHQTGEPMIEIEINQEKNSQYAYRQADEQGKMLKTAQDIMAEWQGNTFEDGQENIILKYDFSNSREFQEYHQTMQKLLGSGEYAMTRYFRDAKEKGDAGYMVLEKTVQSKRSPKTIKDL